MDIYSLMQLRKDLLTLSGGTSLDLLLKLNYICSSTGQRSVLA